ncbi:MAG TPA: HlyD family efflux transporter periplasmic adaptor subunit [Devosia sp.]
MNEIMAFLTGLLALVPGMGPAPEPSWNGYVEADYVYVGAPSAGTIETVVAREGQAVKAGEVLFILDSRQQQAVLRAAEARVEAARANAENLATGSRAAEIDVIRANLEKANADLALAQSQSERSDKLLVEGLVPQAKADQDRATLRSAYAQVNQLEAQLRVAELPARDPQRVAAEATLVAAEADADKAREDLADRTVLAPADGRIERLYFSGGELAPAGTPVVALQPADALKVKFYLAEADRPEFALGETLKISCDGCGTGLSATVSFFASDPQFTPPVIYSRDERARLTFLAEATLATDSALHPGQPVTVAK